MKDELFQELLKSVKEGAEIFQGKREPSRLFVVKDGEIVEVANEAEKNKWSKSRQSDM